MKLTLGVIAGALIVVFVLVFGSWAFGASVRHCGVQASWYGKESCIADPCRTRSGELFDGNDLTAAMLSKTHIGERWRVSLGKKSVDVRINDTGGFAKYGRGIDLSKRAFAELAPLARGTLTVCLERLS